MKDGVLLTGDASRLLNASYQAIYNYIRRGALKDRRTPSGWRYFLRSELEELRRQKPMVAEGDRG